MLVCCIFFKIFCNCKYKGIIILDVCFNSFNNFISLGFIRLEGKIF